MKEPPLQMDLSRTHQPAAAKQLPWFSCVCPSLSHNLSGALAGFARLRNEPLRC